MYNYDRKMLNTEIYLGDIATLITNVKHVSGKIAEQYNLCVLSSHRDYALLVESGETIELYPKFNLGDKFTTVKNGEYKTCQVFDGILDIAPNEAIGVNAKSGMIFVDDVRKIGPLSRKQSVSFGSLKMFQITTYKKFNDWLKSEAIKPEIEHVEPFGVEKLRKGYSHLFPETHEIDLGLE